MLHGKSPFGSDNFSSIVFNIKNTELEIKKDLSKLSQFFLKQTLEKNPQKRPETLSSHPLFEEVNWKKVERKESSVIHFKYEKEAKSEINYKIDVDYSAENYPKNKIIGW